MCFQRPLLTSILFKTHFLIPKCAPCLALILVNKTHPKSALIRLCDNKSVSLKGYVYTCSFIKRRRWPVAMLGNVVGLRFQYEVEPVPSIEKGPYADFMLFISCKHKHAEFFCPLSECSISEASGYGPIWRLSQLIVGNGGKFG